MRFEKMGRQVGSQGPLLAVRCMAPTGVMEGREIGNILVEAVVVGSAGTARSAGSAGSRRRKAKAAAKKK